MSTQTLLGRMAELAEFAHWRDQLAFIEGFLRDLEGHALLLLAAHGQGLGQIVEIGSYLGRSTAYLAAGSRLAGREKVTAIDHFRGSPEHQPGQQFQSQVLLQEGSTYPRFRANLQRAGLDDQVTALVASSADAARDWSQPIRLLFIDGDHSYEVSSADFALWSPFVVSRGIICFHDINQWPGVTRFYKELIPASPDFQEVATVCSLKVVQRR